MAHKIQIRLIPDFDKIPEIVKSCFQMMNEKKFGMSKHLEN